MPLNLGKAMAGDQRIHVVAPKFGVQPSGELYRAEHLRREQATQSAKLGLDKTVIKSGVVSDKHLVLQLRLKLVRHFLKQRRIRHHLIGNAGKVLDKRGYPRFRVQQRLPLPHHLTGPPEPDTNLGNPVTG